MKFVIDMNLSPAWCEALKQAGYEAVHWSEVGDPKATDATVMAWATEHEAVVFTHDQPASRRCPTRQNPARLEGLGHVPCGPVGRSPALDGVWAGPAVVLSRQAKFLSGTTGLVGPRRPASTARRRGRGSPTWPARSRR